MADKMLTGIRVIVTRPEAQAPSWQRQLEAAGAEALSVPMLCIKPLKTPAELQGVKNIILDIDHYAAVIFVSQNAVAYGWDWLDRYWPELPLGLQWLAVGKTTAAKLRQLGLAVTAAGEAMNSEALLALPQLQQVAGQKIAIFRGCGGRPLLGETLEARGASVDYCELYHRDLPVDAAAQLAAITPAAGDVISVHSGETLDNLNQLVAAGDTDWKQRPILVPGARVGDRASRLGFGRVIVAENATDNAMLAALLAWRAENPAV